MKLYQYLSFEKGSYILLNECLPLGHFYNYNDPFEGALGDINYNDYSNLYDIKDEELKRKEINKLVSKLTVNIQTTTESNELISDSILKLAVGSFIPLGLFGSLAVVGCGILYNMLKDNPNAFRDNYSDCAFGIIQKLKNLHTTCLSEKHNNLLMWSHYANSHKGMVLGFNSKLLPFDKNDIRKIHYDKERFRPNVSNEEKSVIDFLSTKSKEWRYEKEWRCFFDIEERKKDIAGYDYHLNPVVKLDLNSISAIYLGSRMTDENKHKITDIMEMKGIDIRKLHTFRLSNSNFRIIADNENEEE